MMRNRKPMALGVSIPIVVGVLFLIALIFTPDWDRPPVEATQLGYRGTAMEQVVNPRRVAAEAADHEAPPAPWELELVGDGAELASDYYENLQVLGHLEIDQFDRLMAAMTEWVAPEEEGCNYCHNPENLADDNVYTKVVARRMVQMTQYLNESWGDHVGETGVTCYTCHRGEPVPQNIWFGRDPQMAGLTGGKAGQNSIARNAGDTSLPYDPFTPLLSAPLSSDETGARVVAATALPTPANDQPIQNAETTYSLMVHMSEALGVNCTFCHNSRAFADWQESTPQRTTAWHGLEMARTLNASFLEPLGVHLPAHRIGPDFGDAPKLNCATCHAGANLPLNGAPMLADFPSLAAAPPSE